MPILNALESKGAAMGIGITSKQYNHPALNNPASGGELASKKNMILLITPSARGPECAACLFAETSQETQWAKSLQEAAARLREQTYAVAVIDQFLLETEPE